MSASVAFFTPTPPLEASTDILLAKDDTARDIPSGDSREVGTVASAIAGSSSRPGDDIQMIHDVRGPASSSVQALAIDPLNMGRHRRENVNEKQMKIDHPKGNKRKLVKYYSKQNDLIDQFLGAEDEERLAVEEDIRVRPKIKFAVYASFTANFCLFIIQLYAAISTGSLSVSPADSPIMGESETNSTILLSSSLLLLLMHL
jgi:hypothetical protein